MKDPLNRVPSQRRHWAPGHEEVEDTTAGLPIFVLAAFFEQRFI